MPSRRALLGGAALAAAGIGLGVAAMGGDEQPEQSGTPRSAEGDRTAAGFTRLVFEDDFDDLVTIDRTGRGLPGHRWYTSGVKHWGQADFPAADLTVADSVLRLDPSQTNFNFNLSTADGNTGEGQTFGHGHFAARMRFGTRVRPAAATKDGRFGWPSFWAISQAYALGRPGVTSWGELDIFEAAAGAQDYVGTVHDWNASAKGVHAFNSNHVHPTQADFSQWHEVGCLWQPGRAAWYLDGAFLFEQTWGDRGVAPAPSDVGGKSRADVFEVVDEEVDRDGMTLVLGSGRGRPLEVDWVKVWGPA